MKKVILILVVLLCITACRKEADLVGTKWITRENSVYQFNSDGTCKKNTNKSFYYCTYTKNNGVIDIKLDNGTVESGQINHDRIIIGSEVYKKGE